MSLLAYTAVSNASDSSQKMHDEHHNKGHGHDGTQGYLTLTAGALRKIPMSTGSVAREFYNFASAAGHSENDWTTGIFRAMESISKIN